MPILCYDIISSLFSPDNQIRQLWVRIKCIQKLHRCYRILASLIQMPQNTRYCRRFHDIRFYLKYNHRTTTFPRNLCAVARFCLGHHGHIASGFYLCGKCRIIRYRILRNIPLLVPFVYPLAGFLENVTCKQIFYLKTVCRIQQYAKVISADTIYDRSLADHIVANRKNIFIRIFFMQLCKNIVQRLIIGINNIRILRILIH